MQSSTCSVQPRPARRSLRSRPAATPQIAIDEFELAARWGLSVRTLRRWRTEQLGPVFCKLGARISYLIAEIEAFERRHARYSTKVSVFLEGTPMGGAA